MAKGIIRLVECALKNVSGQISRDTDPNDLYSRGLASEGYNGGYRDALNDVLLALNGVIPNRYGWWDKRQEK